VEVGVRGDAEERKQEEKQRKRSTSHNSDIEHFKCRQLPSPLPLLQDEKWFQILRKQKPKPSPTKEPCHHAFFCSPERNLILNCSLER